MIIRVLVTGSRNWPQGNPESYDPTHQYARAFNILFSVVDGV